MVGLLRDSNNLCLNKHLDYHTWWLTILALFTPLNASLLVDIKITKFFKLKEERNREEKGHLLNSCYVLDTKLNTLYLLFHLILIATLVKQQQQ